VQQICEQCTVCKKAKSRVQLHGLYTPLAVPSEPWVDTLWTLFQIYLGQRKVETLFLL